MLAAGGIYFALSDTDTHTDTGPTNPSPPEQESIAPPQKVELSGAPSNQPEASPQTSRELDKAETFLRNGNLKRALRFFEKHLEQHAADENLKKRIAIIYHNYAAELFNHQEFHDALDAANRGLELEPSSRPLLKLRSILRSRLAQEQSDLDEKINLLEAALADDDNNISALLQRAEAAETMNELDDALSLYQQIAQKNAQVTGLDSKIARLQQSASVEKEFTTVEHHHFIARFEGYAQERLAWIALNVLEKAYFSINERLHMEPKEKITVVIYTGEQFRTALNVPDWSGGIYDGKIRIREGDLLTQQDKLRDVLYHEYTHALLSHHAGPTIPTWLNEGMAQLMEPSYSTRSDHTGRARLFHAAHAQDALFSPQDLTGSFLSIQDPQVVRLAYAQSVSWTESLVKRQGYFGVAEFVRHFATSKQFERSFQDKFHISMDRFFDVWLHDHISE